MKYKINSFFSYLLIIALLFVTFSCNKDDDPVEEIRGDYYITSTYLEDGSKSEPGLQVVYAYMAEVYPSAFPMVTAVKSGIEVYKITYETEFQGSTIEASGLVCLPDEPGEYPVLSFQNGTNTLHANAPSVNYKDAMYSIIEGVASMGFIVVIPDYIGFGDAADVPHPYLHAESTVQSVVDMIRAGKEFTEMEETLAQPNDDLFIWGYSQGGWATLHLQKEIEQNLSSEFNLVASACGAGPYKMASLNEYVLSQETYPMPYFLAYIVHGHKSVGSITNEYSDIFKETYAVKIDNLFDGMHTGDEINDELTTTVADLLTTDYISGYAESPDFSSVRNAFENNSVTAWNVSTPTRLIHAEEDVYVPVSISEQMLSEFRDVGVSESTLELIKIPNYDHPGGVVPTGINTILWFLEFID